MKPTDSLNTEQRGFPRWPLLLQVGVVMQILAFFAGVLFSFLGPFVHLGVLAGVYVSASVASVFAYAAGILLHMMESKEATDGAYIFSCFCGVSLTCSSFFTFGLGMVAILELTELFKP